MPVFDIIHRNGKREEVFVHSRKEVDAMGAKIAPSRIHVGGRPTEESFSSAIMRGYRQAELKGQRLNWKPETIKNAWKN